MAKTANSIPGFIRESTAGRSRQVILLLYSVLVRPYLECCYFLTFPVHLHIPESAQQRAAKMTKELEHLSWEESLEKRRLRGIVTEGRVQRWQSQALLRDTQ